MCVDSNALNDDGVLQMNKELIVRVRSKERASRASRREARRGAKGGDRCLVVVGALCFPAPYIERQKNK